MAASLAVLEHKTLLIDADPQANATTGAGFDPKIVKASVYDALVNERTSKDLLLETQTPNLYLLPSDLDLVGAEIELINHPNREKILKNSLASLKEGLIILLLIVLLH